MTAWRVTYDERNITVASEGGGDYDTIQEAVDVAVDGDIIGVEDGTYVEKVVLSTAGVKIVGESNDGCDVSYADATPYSRGIVAAFIVKADRIVLSTMKISATGQTTGAISFVKEAGEDAHSHPKDCVIENCVLTSEYGVVWGSSHRGIHHGNTYNVSNRGWHVSGQCEATGPSIFTDSNNPPDPLIVYSIDETFNIISTTLTVADPKDCIVFWHSAGNIVGHIRGLTITQGNAQDTLTQHGIRLVNSADDAAYYTRVFVENASVSMSGGDASHKAQGIELDASSVLSVGSADIRISYSTISCTGTHDYDIEVRASTVNAQVRLFVDANTDYTLSAGTICTQTAEGWFFTVAILLGPANDSLTLNAQLVDSDGNDFGNLITTGFTNLGDGNYQWVWPSMPAGFRGTIQFIDQATAVVLSTYGIDEQMEKVLKVCQYLFNKTTATATKLTVYADDGVTPIADMTLADDGATQTKGAAP